MVLFEKILSKEEETGIKAVIYRQNRLDAPHRSDKLISLAPFFVVAAVRALAVRIKVNISVKL